MSSFSDQDLSAISGHYVSIGDKKGEAIADELLRLRAALREILECESPRDMFETAKEALDSDAE
tara:strand:- start:34 stop:225 length:192 start_codon:yes stop_codon:yes gene_type:complete